MHDNVTRPKGSMVVVVTLKSKMAASSESSEYIVKVRSIWPISRLKKIPQAAARRPSHIRIYVNVFAT